MRTRIGLVGLLAGAMLLAVIAPVMAAHLTQAGGVDVALTPYAKLAGTWDSNPFLVDQGADDFFFGELEAGGNLDLKGRILTLQLGAFIGERRYSKDVPSDLEDPSFGEHVTLSLGNRDTARLHLYESYQDVTDYSQMVERGDNIADTGSSVLGEDRSDRTRRKLFDFSGSIGRDFTDKILGDLRFGAHDVNYDSESLYDSTRYEIGAQVGWSVTPKGAVFGYGEYGVESSDAYTGDAGLYTVQVGYMTRATDKLELRAAVGVQTYESTTLVAAGGKPETSADSQTGLALDITGRWRATDRLSIALFAERGISAATVEPSMREVTRAGIGATQAVASKFGLTAGCSYRNDNYLTESPSTGDKRQVDTFGVNAGAIYQPRQCVGVVLNASFEDSNSNFEGEDYAQTRVTLGTRFQY
jgi:hypothetical protein